MADELIDLTQIKPDKAFLEPIGFADIVLIVVGGGVGFLAKEAFKYFFPGKATVAEQLEVLTKLIEAAGKARAKMLKVRISSNANTVLELPKTILEAKVLSQNADTIDLEIVFAPQPQRGAGHRRGRTGKPSSGSHSPYSRKPRPSPAARQCPQEDASVAPESS
jgi:hypothetical protein